MDDDDGDRALRAEADFHDAFYEESADHIYASVAYSLVKQRNLEFILRNVPRSGTKDLISLGCGNGNFEHTLSAYFRTVRGVDLSPRAISLARERASTLGLANTTFHVGDAGTISLADDSVDVVLVLSTFHHLSEAAIHSLIAEARRVLRSGGVLLSVDPNRYRLLGLFKFLVARTFARYHSPEERVIPPSLLTGAMRRAGFRRVRVEWLDFFYNPLCWVFPGMPAAVARGLSAVDRAVVSVPLLNRLGNAFGVVGWVSP